MMRQAMIALVAGLIAPLALAPFDIWPLALASLIALAKLTAPSPSRALFSSSFFYGLGYYGLGVSWVFVSIHSYGGVGPLLAGLMTLLFITALSLVFALPFWLLGRLANTSAHWLLGFPLCWSTGEWLRTWLFTGFPWLNPGYGFIDTPLAGWAPVAGILGLGFILALCAAGFALIRDKSSLRLALLLAILTIGSGWSLQQQPWTTAAGEPLTVGIVQPNIDQNLKWERDYFTTTIDRLNQHTNALITQSDWIVWPEAAIPLLESKAFHYLSMINQQALEHEVSLFTGILSDVYDDQGLSIYNSILGLGEADGQYFKQRLVPFGEYVPLKHTIQDWLPFFDLPMSNITKGNSQQGTLTAGDYQVAASVCYEIAYSHLIARQARDSHALITVSNDAWFGTSIGPKQHAQMARMRALETGRFIVRATNTGHSFIANANGAVVQRAKPYIVTHTQASIVPMKGNTPYMLWGDWPMIILLIVIVIVMRYRVH